MPAIQRSEFSLALNQVASERGVDVDVVLDTVKNAILAAYRKDHAGVEVEEFRAELNANTGEAKIFHNDKDVTPPGFGRIAAQTAKQVILQKIREKEKEAIFTDYKVKIGTVINGMILRFAGANIIVDIGKTEAIMPPSEQVQNEKYHLNQRLGFYLSEIREGMKGDEIVVSRAANGLVEGLFKREVPEIAQGSVEIKAVVREPGNRSKVAVFSTQSGIDPVGSCVGQKGVRVQSIIQELGGLEKVDIIQWAEDTKTYIAQALSPAKNVRVEINEEEKTARVFVPTEELSLAIGKEGQNVRLAHKLTGYRIEIEGTGEVSEEPASDAAAADETKVKKVSADESLEKVKKPKKEAETKTDEEVIEEKASENPAVEPAPIEEMKVEPVDSGTEKKIEEKAE
ncbi:MAG TPA: transcription termination factor NusA [Xanthomonadales bacterium]|nr:transcription termination factor NusA [Xanthomonadales bacterium]